MKPNTTSIILARREAEAVIDIETSRLVKAALEYAHFAAQSGRKSDPMVDEICEQRRDDLMLQACRFRHAMERIDNTEHEERVLGTMVHILYQGASLCHRAQVIGAPSEWEPGHSWVRVEEAGDATCRDCIVVEANRNKYKVL
jgi:hypothetical protein